MSTHYAGELKQSKHKTDANGHVQFAELPDVVGKEAGVLADTIETPDCSVTVRVPWGKGSYHRALSFEAAARFRRLAPDPFLQGNPGRFSKLRASSGRYGNNPRLSVSGLLPR